MKKSFTLFCILSLCVFANAQSFDFPLNEHGLCELSGSTSLGEDVHPEAAYINMLTTAQSIMELSSIEEDPDNMTVKFTGSFNFKTLYTPLTGAFRQNMIVSGELKIQNGIFCYKIKNPQIEKHYAGYTVKSTVDLLSKYIKDYNKALKEREEILNDPALSKKDRKQKMKEIDDTISDTGAILEKAYSEYRHRFDQLLDSVK